MWLLAIGSLLMVLSLVVMRPLSDEHQEEKVQKALQSQVDERYKLVDDMLQSVVANPESPETVSDFPGKRSGESAIFVYEAGMLKWWSSNLVPEPFPYPGEPGAWFTIKMANGWYAGKAIIHQQYTIVALALIYADYRYENAYLSDGFTGMAGVQASIVSPDVALPEDFIVKDPDQREVIAIRRIKLIRKHEHSMIWLAVLFIMGMVLNCIGLLCVFLTVKRLNNWLKIALVWITIFGIRLFMFLEDVRILWSDNELFDPVWYASSSLFPSLGDFVINTLLFLIVSVFTWKLVRRIRIEIKYSFLRYSIFIVAIAFSIYLGFVLIWLGKSLILDGKLNLDVTNILHLDSLSYLAFLSMGVLFSAIGLLVSAIVGLASALIESTKEKWVIVVFLAGWSGIFVSWYFSAPALLYIWPGILVISQLRTSKKTKTKFWRFGAVFNQLLQFAIVTTFLINHYTQLKEQESRVILAERLAQSEDPLIEIKYLEIQEQLKDDAVLHAFIVGQIESKEDLIIHLENLYFRDVWDRYEMEYYVYRNDSSAVSFDPYALSVDYTEFIRTIEQHGRVSEQSTGMYQVGDYHNKLSYLINLPVGLDSVLGFMVVEMRSKQLPDDIGFPELLIDRSSKTLQELARYGVARYSNNKLVTRVGDYDYPVDAGYFSKWIKSAENQGYVFFSDGERNHLLWLGDQESIMIISLSRSPILNMATTFSYLLLLSGFLLGLIYLVDQYLVRWEPFRIGLNAKVRILIMGVLLITLFLFGIGTRYFILKEYTDKNNRLISEKLASVHEEMKKKVGRETSIDASMRNYLNFVMKRFSDIFFTDIILYDTDGRKLASSRNEVFYSGLLSELMHPKAYQRLHEEDRIEFIHEEMIGKLNYLCAYAPLLNNEGQVLGYLALPYFAKQNPLESEISNLLVTLINIFVLLLALGVVAALYVTNWVTKPLKTLQDSLASIQLGKLNKQLDYAGSDEIGSLVKVYNQKVEELEQAAAALARSERESAWREMARQVAHEIKNPLTPMKLSVQHFQRTFNKDDEEAKERLERFSKMLIEQIDTLTNIANEFSSFAKMPMSKATGVIVSEVVENVVQLFIDSSEAEISYQDESSLTMIYIDKDELIRVLTNLIKNAVQALPVQRHGKILVRTWLEKGKIYVSVTDNGTGIAREARGKIFQPNFTTKSSGSGLGLAMVKSIVEQAGGQIWFEDNSTGGTIFFIEFPITESS